MSTDQQNILEGCGKSEEEHITEFESPKGE